MEDHQFFAPIPSLDEPQEVPAAVELEAARWIARKLASGVRAIGGRLRPGEDDHAPHQV